MVIQTEAGLAEFCSEVRGERALFVDTEFVGEGRYYPDVGAIQLYAAGRAALIDPLAVRDFSPLQRPRSPTPASRKCFTPPGRT